MLSGVKTFKGANVFMSRNLVAPEVFDTLLDALKLNGADVFLCCDPSRNGANDFHVISSMDHEKFEDLRDKNCTLLGPQCVVTCAKEHRPLPKQEFTCCLAMDDVKVLASGFDVDEKNKIEKLVTAMGGQVLSKASLDVSFVIVKNVLAAKYKWALHILKKPVVSIDWLFQCWNEHRVVSHESYRVLPFSGLMICVTRIPPEERKEIEKVITQNGGKYSPELTKKCTHLICPVMDVSVTRWSAYSHLLFFFKSFSPEGDKYKVARRWGHIHIVTRKWLDQSIVRKACLDEESYPVQGGPISSTKTGKGSFVSDQRQDKCTENSTPVLSSMVGASSFSTFPAAADPDLEATLSQNMSSMFSDPAFFPKEEEKFEPTERATHAIDLDGTTANDSESEDDDDLFLSECRISLVGFEASVLRKLVNMVRRGGGSRYMQYSDKLLTHLVVGAPSEIEKKELRSLAASGVTHVVRTTWLEDCVRQRKEVPVLPHHFAYDLLIPKDSLGSVKGPIGGKVGINQAKVSGFQPSNNSDELLASSNSGYQELVEKKKEKPKTNLIKETSLQVASRLSQLKKSHTRNNLQKSEKQRQHGQTQHDFSDQKMQHNKSVGVFNGKRFCFSKSFPEDRRAEIVEWISQGGGELLDDHVTQNIHFTIECHGAQTKPSCFTQTTHVSSHWVRSCLEDGGLLDVHGHVIYSPLTCQIPLPGFENYKFCVSQYEEKDRLLLRNLCYVLGAKFVEKLTKKVTHLLCKFANGPKYEAACKWGIHSITSEWIYECVRQNEVVPLDPFRPKEVTSQDLEAGVCTVTQFPTQSVQMTSMGCPSEVGSHSHDNTANEPSGSLTASFREEAQQSMRYFKKTRLLDDKDQREMLSFQKKDMVSSRAALNESMSKVNSTGGSNLKENGESSHGVPDVAAAIEDLLEQTSKIHDQKSPARREGDKSPFPSERAMLSEDHGGSHPVIGLSKNWLNRPGKREDSSNPSKEMRAGTYDAFSETQTESQVVGYEEDLSGRQMLIDRVRTRSGSIN